jgi:hypothetical protein
VTEQPDWKRFGRVVLLTLRLVGLVCLCVFISVIAIDICVYRDVPTEQEIGTSCVWGAMIGALVGPAIHFFLVWRANHGSRSDKRPLT